MNLSKRLSSSLSKRDGIQRSISTQHKIRALENFEEVLRQRKILMGRYWAENSKKYREAYIQAQEYTLSKTKAKLKSIIVGKTVLQDQLHRTTNLCHRICNDLGRPQDCRQYNDVCNLNSDFWNFTTNLISFKLLREYMNKCCAIEERKIMRGVVVPGSEYLEEITNLSGVIDEVEREVVEEEKNKNEDEDEDEQGKNNMKR
ncbi:hypothetical protein BDA99DRAFT_594597 [Phascolomyces articulosus]|uniref:Uncharacterized protein n=1 Tax=Phascolomyces articulosus TaxID=60185 RepID=A0AAD5KHX1_9FUNG|nr:hypothetical protein BDA99DRAFT_594597 [Phascolomyces articulosus]